MSSQVESGAAAETPEQASEQAGALGYGPLTSAQVSRIDALVAAA
jgi:hypothetical protein